MSNINFRSGNPRTVVYYGIIVVAVLLLMGGFYNLQILQESVYQSKSEENSIKRETQLPVRGNIYDRNWGKFQFTDAVFNRLRTNGFPPYLIGELEKKTFASESTFLDYLNSAIGREETRRYRSLLLTYAQVGKLIVDNRPSFSLYIVPALTKKEQLAPLAEVLNIPTSQIQKKLRRSRRFQPVKIARYVSDSTLVKLQENRLDFPGLEWKIEPKRNYRYRRSFSHVLGTLGEIGEHELATFNKNEDDRKKRYEAGDIIGKKGIERAKDKSLRGEKGYRLVKVDAVGRRVADITDADDALAHPGKDLYLTIDARLQQHADSIFGDRNGAFVAVDVRNGEILTLLSKPDYDLNLFAEAVKPAVWKQLMADKSKPLFDRATQATYPPGSTYKMVAAIAGLNEGIVSPQWHVFCPGYFQIGARTIRCWNAGGHGEVNAVSAIRGSCNVYFYQLGLKIGIEQWTKYSKLFLFGEPTGIEMRTERQGLVPSREYYDKVYGKRKWTKGMLANIAIGQGELLVTPLQMAQFAMLLANRGKYHPLHLTKKMVDKIPDYKLTDESLPALRERLPEEIVNSLSPLKDNIYSKRQFVKALKNIFGIARAGEYEPVILEHAEKIYPAPDMPEAEARQITGVDSLVYDIMLEGMRQVVAGGTGWRAGVWQKTGAGKTGTAQNPHGDSHAWYIGFAPYENPEIAVAVILENGGSGGGIAAPVVGEYLQEYFHLKGEFNYKEFRAYQRILWEKQQEAARQDSIQAAQAVADSLRNLQQ